MDLHPQVEKSLDYEWKLKQLFWGQEADKSGHGFDRGQQPVMGVLVNVYSPLSKRKPRFLAFLVYIL